MTRRPSTIPRGSSEPIGPAPVSDHVNAHDDDAFAHLDYDVAPGLGAVDDEVTIGIVPDPRMSDPGASRPTPELRPRRRTADG